MLSTISLHQELWQLLSQQVFKAYTNQRRSCLILARGGILCATSFNGRQLPLKSPLTRAANASHERVKRVRVKESEIALHGELSLDEIVR